tara:strand:- start:105 stop:371 length:267 start_codon:yes stop_codon:yes gene_type:complete
MSLNWEKVTYVAAAKEISGSIMKIYAEAAQELNPTSFGTYVEGGTDVIHQTVSNAITIPVGDYLEGPIVRTKTTGISVVYHNGVLIVK